MYAPRFVISNEVLMNVGQIEAAKDVIENAPLVPHFEKDFKTDALIRTVHHGTRIEGNDLTIDQTKQILEGEQVYARQRDVQEVINYRNVISLIDELSNREGPYLVRDLLDIHRLTVANLVAPEKTGVLRNSQVVIKEEGTGKVIFTPPSFVEVPYLLEDFFTWLNSPESQEIHPVLRAGIVHYVLVTIHPFVEGNGRTTRAFAMLVLHKEGYDIKRFFSLEENFDRDLDEYYDAFYRVDQQGGDIASRDLTPWLEYFTEVVAVELTKIKEKVRKISVDSRLRVKIGEQVALSARQIKLVEYLSDKGYGAMRELKEVVPMVSEDTILRDLKDLMQKNVIEKEGSTKAARYVIKR